MADCFCGGGLDYGVVESDSNPAAGRLGLSLTESQIFACVRTFLLSVLPGGVEVIRGQDNRVPEPQASDFITMIPVIRRRLSTNGTIWDSDAGTRTDLTPTFMTIQLDLHGPSASDFAQIVISAWRSDFAAQEIAAINPAIAPLHAEEARQTAFLNGEQQIEDRWTLDIALQVNPVISQTFTEFVEEITVEPAIPADL